MRIVERAGNKLKSLLHRSDPWAGQKCNDERCLICTNPYNKTYNCSKRNIVYKSVCLTCKDLEKKEALEDDRVVGDTIENVNDEKSYWGESHVSGRERSLQHSYDFSSKKDDSHQYKHYTEAHRDMDMKDVKFGVTVLRQFFSSFSCQIFEAVLIFKNSNNLNSKSMWNRSKVPRLSVMFQEHEEAKKADRDKHDNEELSLEINKLKQKHNVEKSLEDPPPPPNKKFRKWNNSKGRKKPNIENDVKSSDSRSIEETNSLPCERAAKDPEVVKDSNEDRGKQLWPLFEANSLFVFNAKENVKDGGTIEKRNAKVVDGTKRRRYNKKRDLKSNKSILNYLVTASEGSTNNNQTKF